MPPKSVIPVPPRVRSLIGARFGRLLVKHFAGMQAHKSYWCCECDCGNLCRVRGEMLLGTSKNKSQRSCGCERADPAVRLAARLKVPAKRRAEICNAMRKAVKQPKPAYSMDAHRAADLLGVSLERIEILAKDGLIGHRWKNGALWVSSGDVSNLIATQQRNKKHCKAIEDWKMGKH